MMTMVILCDTGDEHFSSIRGISEMFQEKYDKCELNFCKANPTWNLVVMGLTGEEAEKVHSIWNHRSTGYWVT